MGDRGWTPGGGGGTAGGDGSAGASSAPEGGARAGRLKRLGERSGSQKNVSLGGVEKKDVHYTPEEVGSKQETWRQIEQSSREAAGREGGVDVAASQARISQALLEMGKDEDNEGGSVIRAFSLLAAQSQAGGDLSRSSLSKWTMSLPADIRPSEDELEQLLARLDPRSTDRIDFGWEKKHNPHSPLPAPHPLPTPQPQPLKSISHSTYGNAARAHPES